MCVVDTTKTQVFSHVCYLWVGLAESQPPGRSPSVWWFCSAATFPKGGRQTVCVLGE